MQIDICAGNISVISSREEDDEDNTICYRNKSPSST